ncbi:MAG TPA: hypothetical protein PLW22_11280, partial [Tenuifilum sp.]|nr:hypothetical protein [Tenuifilum sp.]
MQSTQFAHRVLKLFAIVLLLQFPFSVFSQPKSDSIAVKALIDSAANAKSPQVRIAFAREAYHKAIATNSKRLLADATHAMGNALFRLNSYDTAI